MKVHPINASVLEKVLPRPEDSHKGTFGTLTMLCGSPTMTGAAILSALGALRSGVGLLQVAVPESVMPILQARLPEPVWLTPEQLPDRRATAFLCGPGLGRTQDERLEHLLPIIRVPAVYDADCINFLAKHKDVLNRLSSPFVLTPHEMEFSRLTGRTTDEIHTNREAFASEAAKQFGCTIVLKGHRTVVASPDGDVFVNTSGCSALAKGGSGDVLAGVIGSLLAQGYSPTDAACISVYVHGLVGERLAKTFGLHGVLPSDLPAEIGRILG